MTKYCHMCQYCEVMPTGPLLCVWSSWGALPTRAMRMEEAECGPEAKLYEPRKPEHEGQ